MRLLLLYILLSLMGCQSMGVSNIKTNDSNAIAITEKHPGIVCTSPRPTICTREYRPVCALRNNSKDLVTYATGCTACADNKVLSYMAGACEDLKSEAP